MTVQFVLRSFFLQSGLFAYEHFKIVQVLCGWIHRHPHMALKIKRHMFSLIVVVSYVVAACIDQWRPADGAICDIN